MKTISHFVFALLLLCAYGQKSGFQPLAVLQPPSHDVYKDFPKRMTAHGDKILLSTGFIEVLLYEFDNVDFEWKMKQRFRPPGMRDNDLSPRGTKQFGQVMSITDDEQIIIHEPNFIFSYNKKPDGTYPTNPDTIVENPDFLFKSAAQTSNLIVFGDGTELMLYNSETKTSDVVTIDIGVVETVAISPDGLVIASIQFSFFNSKQSLTVFERTSLNDKFEKLDIDSSSFFHDQKPLGISFENLISFTENKFLVCSEILQKCTLIKKTTSGWDWSGGTVVAEGSMIKGYIYENTIVTKFRDNPREPGGIVEVFEIQPDESIKRVGQMKTVLEDFLFANGNIFVFQYGKGVEVVSLDDLTTNRSIAPPVDIPQDNQRYGSLMEQTGDTLAISGLAIEKGVDVFRLSCSGVPSKDGGYENVPVPSLGSSLFPVVDASVSVSPDGKYVGFSGRNGHSIYVSPNWTLVASFPGTGHNPIIWLGNKLTIQHDGKIEVRATTNGFPVVQTITLPGSNTYWFKMLDTIMVTYGSVGFVIFERTSIDSEWPTAGHIVTGKTEGITQSFSISYNHIIFTNSDGQVYVIEKTGNNWPSTVEGTAAFSVSHDRYGSLKMQSAVYNGLIVIATWEPTSSDVILQFFRKRAGTWKLQETQKLQHGSSRFIYEMTMNDKYLTVALEQGVYNGYGAGVVHVFGRCDGDPTLTPTISTKSPTSSTKPPTSSTKPPTSSTKSPTSSTKPPTTSPMSPSGNITGSSSSPSIMPMTSFIILVVAFLTFN